jgi:hypothetical protein
MGLVAREDDAGRARQPRARHHGEPSSPFEFLRPAGAVLADHEAR